MKGRVYRATSRRIGRFEEVTWTLFLDEIGELTMPCRSKLLRFLRTGFQGSADTTSRDVRSSAHERILKPWSRRKNSEDLYYLECVVMSFASCERREDSLSDRSFSGALCAEKQKISGIRARRDLLRNMITGNVGNWKTSSRGWSSRNEIIYMEDCLPGRYLVATSVECGRREEVRAP
jgi:DNA-binding NtrC family response regulator